MNSWQNKPFSIEVKAGETKVFCMCGLSKNGPFCDGSHTTTDITPEIVKFDEDKKVLACGCLQSKNRPFCDGSHLKLNEIKKPKKKSKTSTQKVWHQVASLSDLVEGQISTVQAGLKTVALTYINGNVGALKNACPHQGGPLTEGTLNDKGCLQCPWHGWAFDPITGKNDSGSDATCYPVEIRGDDVFVEVEEELNEITTISDIMVETMTNWGVSHVFGMVGHSNLGLAEALRKQESLGRLTFIGIRHEGAAAFAASGFAKASGKPAACLSIAGPGATNLLTGLWDAKVDRAPVLALTGQVNTQVLGPGAFQEIDLASAFQAVTSWSQTVLHESNHAELMSLALKHAIVNRDVTHLIFPDEVQVLKAPDDARALTPEGRLSDVEIAPSAGAIEKAIAEITKAKRPAIIVGYGARESMDIIISFAEKLNCPVITTFKAKGQISDHHPLATGVLGRSGTPIAANCMEEADMLLVLGASFSNHTGISANKPIVQVDFERMALGKFHPVTVPVWGEIGITLQALLLKLPQKLAAVSQQNKIQSLWNQWREEKQRRAEKNQGKGLNSAIVFQHLSDLIPENAVIAVDVGNNTYSFGRYFECKTQKVLMSGYLGSIGFGFPAAMGAWAACPGSAIFAITGDGGFGQYLAEFTTAVKYGMNITHILLNNSELGKISKEQRGGNWQVWQTSLHNPNFAEYAKSCGGLGIRVTENIQIRQAIEQAMAYDGPAIVEIITDVDLI